MIKITYHKKFIKISQIWYPTDLIEKLLKEDSGSDLLFVHGVSLEEANIKGRGYKEYCTWVSDLTMPEDELSSGTNKNVRYEIRRSEKDGIEIAVYGKKELEADPSLLDTFADIYEKMYLSKGMKETMNLTAVKEYMKNDNVLFTAVKKDGEIIVFHTYIYDEKETRLWYSASCFRDENMDQNLIGRVNKRLHWEDLLLFRNKGLKEYDWGGISNFENPNGIDGFKMKFCGFKRVYYNVYAGRSVLGKCVVRALKILKKCEG